MRYLLGTILIISLLLPKEEEFKVGTETLAKSDLEFYKEYGLTYRDMKFKILKESQLTLDEKTIDFVKSKRLQKERELFSFLEYLPKERIKDELKQIEKYNKLIIEKNLADEQAVKYLVKGE